MIAETGILSTSPWNSDLLLKDLQSVLDAGFSFMDADNDSWTRNGWNENKHLDGSSCSQSSNSSDCSEDIDAVWSSLSSGSTSAPTDHDYLNTSLLDYNGLIGEVSPNNCDFDWVVGEDLIVSSADQALREDSSHKEDVFCDVPCLPVLKPKRNRLANDAVISNKHWSKMSLEEQLEAVDSLTYIVSNEMGLREQLDIIRIIEPSAVISPTDKEFVIDLTRLNDSKLCKVREYVRRIQSLQHVRQKKTEELTNGCRDSFASCLSSASSSSSSGSYTSPKNEELDSPVKGRQSKKEPKKKRTPQKLVKQRQKKEYKQLLKERRSGLFKREEILSLSACEIIEEDDVDILG